jgi:rhamnulokinase
MSDTRVDEQLVADHITGDRTALAGMYDRYADTLYDTAAAMLNDRDEAADVLQELATLRGKPFSQLHIVGGGCQNRLLNQLCADACGITVVAGPVEASTLGNIGIQLMTLDELTNVDDFRTVVTGNYALTTFTPHSCHEIARYRAQFQQKRLTKELCA